METNFNNLDYIQNNLCYSVIYHIYQNDSDHINEKWAISDYNIILFLSKLDKYNRLKLFEYYSYLLS